MPPSKLETAIDKFAREIQTRGKLTFKEASSILQVSEEQVEKWAKILSKHKEETGIEIRYPAFGEPEIIAKELVKSIEVEEKIQQVESGKDELENILEQYAGGKVQPETEKPKTEKTEEKATEKVEPPKKKIEFMKFLRQKEKKADIKSGAFLEKELSELEQKLNEIKDVENTINKLQTAELAIEKEVEHTEAEEKALEQVLQNAKRRLVTLKDASFLLIDLVKKRLNEAKKAEISVEELQKVREALKHMEDQIKDIGAGVKLYDKTKVKETLLQTLQSALSGGKNTSE